MICLLAFNLLFSPLVLLNPFFNLSFFYFSLSISFYLSHTFPLLPVLVQYLGLFTLLSHTDTKPSLSQKPHTLWLCLNRRAVGFVRDCIPNMAVHLLDVVSSRGRGKDEVKEGEQDLEDADKSGSHLQFRIQGSTRSP